MSNETHIRKFLIATHGNFAKGIRSALELIIGPVENLFTIEAYTHGNKSIEEDLVRVLKQVSSGEELVIFSDLLGGSVNNQILRYALRGNVHIVSGFNLPVIIEIMLADATSPVDEVIETAILRAKDQLVYVNKLIQEKKENGNDQTNPD